MHLGVNDEDGRIDGLDLVDFLRDAMKPAFHDLTDRILAKQLDELELDPLKLNYEQAQSLLDHVQPMVEDMCGKKAANETMHTVRIRLADLNNKKTQK